MKKYIILLSTILCILACEKDIICIEDTTPYLIIRFYDDDSPQFTKDVVNIKVELEGIEGFYEDQPTITQFTDSIAIPIKVTEDLTRFKLTVSKLDEDDNLVENQDEFELYYDRVNIYVSRSCGYKTVYNEASIILEDDDDNWIKIIETTESPLNITGETSAHVKIYH